jgi:hypothetical protein
MAFKSRRNTALETSKGTKQRPDPSRYAVDYMDHAPMHQLFVLTDGLFRPIQHGTRSQGLSAHGKYRIPGWTVECKFEGPSALNVVDESVFCYLNQRVAAGEGTLIGNDHPERHKYVELMRMSGPLSNQPVTVLKVTGAQIARGIGLTGTGTNSRGMLDSLSRLAETSMRRRVVSDQNGEWSEGQVTMIGLLCADGGYLVALNQEATWKASGEHVGVTWVNMRERRVLSGDVAKRLHTWFSGWAHGHSITRVGIEKLMPHVWGDEPRTADIKYKRMKKLQRALAEIASLRGWVCATVVAKEKTQVHVRKPAFVGSAHAVTAETVGHSAQTGRHGAESGETAAESGGTGVVEPAPANAFQVIQAA